MELYWIRWFHSLSFHSHHKVSINISYVHLTCWTVVVCSYLIHCQYHQLFSSSSVLQGTGCFQPLPLLPQSQCSALCKGKLYKITSVIYFLQLIVSTKFQVQMISITHQRFPDLKKKRNISIFCACVFRPPHFISKIIYMIGNQRWSITEIFYSVLTAQILFYLYF